MGFLSVYGLYKLSQNAFGTKGSASDYYENELKSLIKNYNSNMKVIHNIKEEIDKSIFIIINNSRIDYDINFYNNINKQILSFIKHFSLKGIKKKLDNDHEKLLTVKINLKNISTSYNIKILNESKQHNHKLSKKSPEIYGFTNYQISDINKNIYRLKNLLLYNNDLVLSIRTHMKNNNIENIEIDEIENQLEKLFINKIENIDLNKIYETSKKLLKLCKSYNKNLNNIMADNVLHIAIIKKIFTKLYIKKYKYNYFNNFYYVNTISYKKK